MMAIRSHRWLSIVAVAALIQVMIAARLTSGSIGFDHPGSSGLDYATAIGLGILYVFALFLGSVASLVSRAWIAFAGQTMLAIVLAVYFSKW